LPVNVWRLVYEEKEKEWDERVSLRRRVGSRGKERERTDGGGRGSFGGVGSWNGRTSGVEGFLGFKFRKEEERKKKRTHQQRLLRQ